MLGSDDSGNPICIDNQGRVLIVDHETGFAEAQIVNSSLGHFLEGAMPPHYRESDRSLLVPASSCSSQTRALVL
ncbi:MAG: SMI1/KNR4 family protein [Myxococcales bacterium]|nr:SMI1/KNR4 family protein [Myxococcales bacterium]